MEMEKYELLKKLPCSADLALSDRDQILNLKNVFLENVLVQMNR